MTLALEQLADEAIELRCTDIERALTRHHVQVAALATKVVDHLDRSRSIMATTWNTQRPGHAQLANDRLAALTRLAEQGITPGPGCTVTVGRVTLEAVRDQPPVAHRYEIMRGRERAGWAWLSSDVLGQPYVVLLEDGHGASSDSLSDALMVAAGLLDRQPLTEAGAR